jgi:hypothetical protein
MAFQARLNGVRGTLRFVLEFTAADGAAGRRQVIVRAAEDRPPEIDAEVELVRKTAQGYLVAPAALIPFQGRVRDDHGLADVAYVVTVAPLEAGGKVGKEGKEQKVPVGAFADLVRRREAKALPAEELLKRLKGRPPETPLLKEFRLDPADPASALDLGKLPQALKEKDEKKPQPRYRLRIDLTAIDTDVETGPHTARGKESFTFLVVSENELLAEVAKEEELLGLKLEDEAKRLRDARPTLGKINTDLAAAKAADLPALGERAEGVVEAFERSRTVSGEVADDYRRILRELRANRVSSAVIGRVEKAVCEPLDGVLRREFAQSAEALGDLSKALKGRDPDRARKAGTAAVKQLDGLAERLDKVVGAMHDLDAVNRLIRTLKDLEEEQRKQEELLKKLKEGK